MLVLIGMLSILSACGAKFAEGDPHYYVLEQLQTGVSVDLMSDSTVDVYIIDPFEKKVFATSRATSDDEEMPYELTAYEDTENRLSIEYHNGKTDQFEKRSDSLWKSLETEIEYDVKKKEGEVDYSLNRSEASRQLSGQTFTKHTGEGADRLLFIRDHRLIISVEDTLPPYIANLADSKEYKENETIEFENIELKDSDSGEFIVMHDDRELLRLTINEDDLLEVEDGTTYMKD